MKKIIVICLSIFILLGITLWVLMFTEIGEKTRIYLYEEFTIPKEVVLLEEQDNIKITYTYRWQEESFDIDVNDKEFIKMIQDNISNKQLNNYTSQIGLSILGQYKVNLGNNISFEFDSYNDNGFVMMYDSNKHFLTKINPEIIERIVEIVDEKLTKNVEQYKTNKITITKKEENNYVDIQEKTAIEYIINQCKNIYTKEIHDYMPDIADPDYEIDFNNNIKLLIYNENSRGWLLKGTTLLEAYGLDTFNTILENSFDNIELKRQMFTTDKIYIISPNKQIELTDKESIEKITTNLIYAKIYRPEWLENYNIKEEYNTGIKIKINDSEFLIPGNKIIGNRYVIDKDNKVNLCFTLQNIEQYVNELLGIKQEKYEGYTFIGI